MKRLFETLKQCKRFKETSEFGFLMDDADVIKALTKHNITWEQAEKFFNDNYKKIKLSKN